MLPAVQIDRVVEPRREHRRRPSVELRGAEHDDRLRRTGVVAARRHPHLHERDRRDSTKTSANSARQTRNPILSSRLTLAVRAARASGLQPVQRALAAEHRDRVEERQARARGPRSRCRARASPCPVSARARRSPDAGRSRRSTRSARRMRSPRRALRSRAPWRQLFPTTRRRSASASSETNKNSACSAICTSVVARSCASATARLEARDVESLAVPRRGRTATPRRRARRAASGGCARRSSTRASSDRTSPPTALTRVEVELGDQLVDRQHLAAVFGSPTEQREVVDERVRAGSRRRGTPRPTPRRAASRACRRPGPRISGMCAYTGWSSWPSARRSASTRCVESMRSSPRSTCVMRMSMSSTRVGEEEHRRAVRAHDHEVGDRRPLDRHLAADDVGERAASRRRACGSGPNAACPRPRALGALLGGEIAAAAVVARRPPFLHRLLVALAAPRPRCRSTRTRRRRRAGAARPRDSRRSAGSGGTGPRPSRDRASASPPGSARSTPASSAATSVSSMRRMNVPPVWRACSQLNSAVRTLPMCRKPVGAGENRNADLRARCGLTAEQVLGDHDPLDLVRALVDLRDLRVAHEALGRAGPSCSRCRRAAARSRS